MVARVGTLPVGTRFVTTLTGRGGRVLAHNGPETRVKFEDRAEDTGIVSEVRVRVVEMTH